MFNCRGAVKASPDQDGMQTDVRSSAVYKKLSHIFEPAQVAFEHPDGTVCPYLVLLRAIAGGWPGGKGTVPMPTEIIEILDQIGAVEGDDLSNVVQLALDRLQGVVSGRLVPDWMKIGVGADGQLKQL